MKIRNKIILLSLIAGQLFFTYKGVETAPFFHFGMYSAVQQKVDSVEIIRLQVNDKPFLISNLPLLAQEMLSNNIFYYEQLKKNNFIDANLSVVSKRFETRVSADFYQFLTNRLCNGYIPPDDFNLWLKNYLQSYHTEKIDSLNYQIIKIKAGF